MRHSPGNWRKSSYSGPGDGDSCVEIANHRTLIASSPPSSRP
ncbi:DUF397 domain-containing protein [Streptomyces sp. RG80]